MKSLAKRTARVSEAGKAAVVAALCVLMATPQSFAEGPAGSAPASTPTRKFYPLTDQQKTLHALNRLTFGPRPGDEAMVKKMGLEAWFQQQLHPETIDDSKLDARLNEYPGLKLSRQAMMDAFPSALMIRDKEDKKIGWPADPVEFAIYTDLVARYFDARKADPGVKSDMMGGAALAEKEITLVELQKMWADEEPDPHSFRTKEEAAAIADKRAFIPHLARTDERAVLALEPQARYERLLAMNPLEMLAFRKSITRDGKSADVVAGMDAKQTEAVNAMANDQQTVKDETVEARIVRDVYSERQLEAVMDDFWLNHFSVYTEKSEKEPYLLPSYEREAILPFALGKFEDMLVATAKSPAMLMYLDQMESVGPDSKSQAAKHNKADRKGINENYARELLELHTYGVRCEVSAEHPANKLDPSCAGGYTQQDVIEVAKCFTGWTIDKPGSGGTGEAVFNAAWHEPGPKHVLGKTIEEGGENEAMEVLHMLAISPATATFVSMKMATRFVSDTPPPALVARMADSYLKTGGDIKAVVSTMFHSPEFWAPRVYRAKLKTPIEFVASVARASGAQVENPLVLSQEAKQLGMPIFGKETPNGYSWMSNQWVSSNGLVSRMNFALVFSGGKLAGTKTRWHYLLGLPDDSPLIAAPTPKTEAALETLILGQPAAARTRSSVLTGYNNPAVEDDAEKKLTEQKAKDGSKMAMAAGQPGQPINTMAGLLLGSPDFQRR